jgi:hypothetical protein
MRRLPSSYNDHNKPVSQKMRGLLNKEKDEARKRIIERGIVHFRADAEFMEALLVNADARKTAPGTLCRQVVWDYLQSLKAPQQAVTKGSSETPMVEAPAPMINEPTVPLSLAGSADMDKIIEQLEQVAAALRNANSGQARTKYGD